MWFPYPYGPPQNYERGPTIEDIIQGMKWLEHFKKDMDEEKKHKHTHGRRRDKGSFSFGELWGAILFFSIPVTLAQLWALDYVRHVLNATFTGHP